MRAAKAGGEVMNNMSKEAPFEKHGCEALGTSEGRASLVKISRAKFLCKARTCHCGSLHLI